MAIRLDRFDQWSVTIESPEKCTQIEVKSQTSELIELATVQHKHAVKLNTPIRANYRLNSTIH